MSADLVSRIVLSALYLVVLFFVLHKIDQMLADIREGRDLLRRIAAALEGRKSPAPTPSANVSPTGIEYKPPKF